MNTAENGIWAVNCTDSGIIEIRNKTDVSKSFSMKLFGDRFRELYLEWNVVPCMYITPDSKYIIVTYGIGCIYFILTAEICKQRE